MATLADIKARMDALPIERAEAIAAARADGKTWREIAATLGMTEHGAIKASRIGQDPVE